MRALSLFSGCGGLDLGAEYAGIEIAAQCEIDKDCRVILRKHWPDTIIYEDVRTLDADKLFRDIGSIDIVFGGHPASPSALRDAVKQLVTAVICGRNTSDCYASLGQDGQWRKTRPESSRRRAAKANPGEASLGTYCESWPKWGMSYRGAVGVPVTWSTTKAARLSRLNRRDALPTSGSECSLWPTATVEDAGRAGDPEWAQRWANGETPPTCHQRLRTAALWPTETVNGNHNRAGLSAKAGDGLATAVLWPTPTTRDFKSPDVNPESKRFQRATELNTQAYLADMWATPNAADSIGSHGGGQGRSLRTDTHAMSGVLNPDWVETLFGLPGDWTFSDGLPGEARSSLRGSRREPSQEEALRDARQD